MVEMERMGGMRNTLEVNFGRPEPRLSVLAIHICLKGMGLKAEFIKGLVITENTPQQTAYVTFHQGDKFQEFLTKEGVKKFTVENTIVTAYVKDATVVEKYVRLTDVHIHIEEEAIKAYLSRHGQVKAVRRHMYGALETEEDYIQAPNGRMTVRMVVEKDIPSYLWIEGCRIGVAHEGQPKTCFVCNGKGHHGATCPSRTAGRRWENAGESNKVH